MDNQRNKTFVISIILSICLFGMGCDTLEYYHVTDAPTAEVQPAPAGDASTRQKISMKNEGLDLLTYTVRWNHSDYTVWIDFINNSDSELTIDPAKARCENSDGTILSFEFTDMQVFTLHPKEEKQVHFIFDGKLARQDLLTFHFNGIKKGTRPIPVVMHLLRYAVPYPGIYGSISGSQRSVKSPMEVCQPIKSAVLSSMRGGRPQKH